jgi:hypothetical protein
MTEVTPNSKLGLNIIYVIGTLSNGHNIYLACDGEEKGNFWIMNVTVNTAYIYVYSDVCCFQSLSYTVFSICMGYISILMIRHVRLALSKPISSNKKLQSASGFLKS